MDLWETQAIYKSQVEILKEKETPETMGTLCVARMASLGLQGTLPLNRRSVEFSHLKRYFRHSYGGHSNATNRHIDHVLRREEVERFIRRGYDNLGMKPKNIKDSRKLLWRGNGGCNHGGILSHGSRIVPPKAPPDSEKLVSVFLNFESSLSWRTDCILPTGPANPGHTMILGILIRLACCFGLQIRFTLGLAMRTNM